MHFTDQDLRAAVAAGALDANKLTPLLDFLNGRAATSPVAPAPRFDLAHLLWYAGALIVMGAMGLFSTLAFSAMGGYALAATALAYAVVFTAAGHYLWHHKNLRVPGGLLIAIAVSMAPLAVYGIQDALGLWGHFGRGGTVRDFYVWIKGSWLPMEIAAIVAALIALWRYPYPFIVMIIAFALWFMSMDLTPWIFGRSRVHLGRAPHRVALVRPRRAGGRVLRRPARARRRLCLLAASVRADGVLVRPEPHQQRQRDRQAHLCADQRRPAVDVGAARTARLCGVRHARHRRLPRPPRPTRCSATR